MSSTKIKLAIDASRSIDSLQKTGVELVSDELLKEINKNIDAVYYTPKLISWLPRESQKIIKRKKLWTILGLSFEMLKDRPEILFVPVHTLPFFCPKKTFKIIHDIAFKKSPELYSSFQRWYLNFDLKRCVKKCKKIFVPTQAVKDDLLKYTNVNENKVIVIHHGYNRTENPVSRTWERKKQILYIGRIEDKKNIRNLISGFEIFNKKYPEYNLILAGPIKMKLEQNPGIKLMGYIAGEQKEKLLQESECLVLVSKQEGFGFPILEGWDYKLPVLTADIPVLREVGGDACLFVDPNSVQEISQGLEKITQDKNLQNNLIEKGTQRLKEFDWQKTAEKYLEEILR